MTIVGRSIGEKVGGAGQGVVGGDGVCHSKLARGAGFGFTVGMLVGSLDGSTHGLLAS